MELIKNIKKDKIRIAQNKNPVPMDLFLSFLTVPVIRNFNNLGNHTNWTEFRNDEHELIITGGVCNGGHWLDNIQYGYKMDNQHNNWVNPFYLWDIITDSGKSFFLDYYKFELEAEVTASKNQMNYFKEKLRIETEHFNKISTEFAELKNI